MVAKIIMPEKFFNTLTAICNCDDPRLLVEVDGLYELNKVSHSLKALSRLKLGWHKVTAWPDWHMKDWVIKQMPEKSKQKY